MDTAVSQQARHKAAGIVSLAVIGSRVLGLVRELVFAAMFGAGKHLDAFLAAFQIPNLLRDLFAEGALSTAFTTTFTKTLAREGDAPAWRLANLLISAMIMLMGAVCLVGIALSPLLVQITNFGFHTIPGKFELTVNLTRILFPFILLVSLAAIVMGMLNARFVFGLPASASTVFNFVSVIAGVALALCFDPQSDWRHPHFTERALYGVSLGVLLGGVCQLGMQLPSLWSYGFRWKWIFDLADPRLKEVWMLAWPSIVAGSAVQVNVLINGMFASEIDGARSWLNCAFRLMQFPIGVFGVAIATVTLPSVARQHASSDMTAAGKTIEESLRLAFFLTLPATIGLIVLAPEIIALIYQHGAFSADAVIMTAAALRAYAIGLSGYAAIKVLTPCFSAFNRPRTPLHVGLIGIVLNLGMNLLLVKMLHLGHVGLATTTGIIALLNFLQLTWHLRRIVTLGTAGRWYRYLLTVLACASGCGLIAALVMREIPDNTASLCWQAMRVGAAVMAGSITYFLLCYALRVDEVQNVTSAVLSRIRYSMMK